MLVGGEIGDSVHSLGSRRDEVLELVARRRSLKQIANELGIGESTVNYHIRALKAQYGVYSLAQLADVYASRQGSTVPIDCRNSSSRESPVPFGGDSTAIERLDGHEPTVTFQDALSYRVDAPWVATVEPVIVPGVLEGTNAKLLRGAAIVAIALGMLALVLLGLGVAQGITAALEGVGAAPVS
jgi:DNA-binding CsgD family transcriptional regulator